MASKEDIQNQNELNDGIRDSISIEQELLEVLNRRAGISNETLEGKCKTRSDAIW